MTVSPGPRIVPSAPRLAWCPVVKTSAASVPIHSASSCSSSRCRSIVPFRKRDPVSPVPYLLTASSAPWRTRSSPVRPEVVVGAEHDPSLALHRHDRERRALQHAEVGQCVELARGAQLVQALVVPGFVEDVDVVGHCGGPCYWRFDLDRRRCHHVRSMTDQREIGSDEPTAGDTPAALDAPRRSPSRTCSRRPRSSTDCRCSPRSGRSSPSSRRTLPAVQAAAAAATGFVAGAATLALVRRVSARRVARARAPAPRPRRAADRRHAVVPGRRPPDREAGRVSARLPRSRGSDRAGPGGSGRRGRAPTPSRSGSRSGRAGRSGCPLAAAWTA